MDPIIPQKFKDRYSPLVDDPEAFLQSLLTQPPKSFRANTLKASVREVKSRMESYGFSLRQVPWYPDAFISSSPEIGSTLEHFLGHIYVQELTSMLPALTVNEIRKAGLVLDACAAPGSKATQLAALMDNRGTLVANDLDYQRIKALKFNLERCGCLNAVITNQDLRYYPEKQEFGAILLDAPCSSEGTIRKNPSLLSRWSENDILSKAGLQRQLILKAYGLLSPGGTLVYSTCTFAPEENEGVLDFLLSKTEAKIQEVKIPGLKTSRGIEEFRGKKFSREVKKAVRVWPHQNDTDGFFLAKLVKP